ncbi:hypothetical protein BKA61DRAFT_656158 [Leptodontidium sp. MPI-SDFR-AT-0119]|nr:hypothetical protein BKA61DRAFT_656158 [Leptodontidium sp. MPI-SDFR-AT-0119]
MSSCMILIYLIVINLILRIPIANSSSFPTTSTSSASLPLYQPAPIRPQITATSSVLTIAAFEALMIEDHSKLEKMAVLQLPTKSET